jgi:hypothetical protein
MKQEQVVYRHVALPVSAFDHLKQYQRDTQGRSGKRLTNSEALAAILKEHQHLTEARAGRDHVGHPRTR